MVLYSITYQDGRSMVERRRWYGSEREADDALHSDEIMRKRAQAGPHRHVVEGKVGLLSILNTYAN